MEKIVLLDFCGTVVPFQSFDPYIMGLLRNEGVDQKKIEKAGMGLAALASRAINHYHRDYYLTKRYLVWLTRGIREETFDSYASIYYKEKIENHLIPETDALLKDFKEKGYRVVLLSAASDKYLSIYANEMGIDYIICSKIRFVRGVSSGRLVSDCIGVKKVEMLRKAGFSNDNYYVGISDSKSDLPMLNMCDEKIVISSSHQDWVLSDMKEVIINDYNNH